MEPSTEAKHPSGGETLRRSCMSSGGLRFHPDLYFRTRIPSQRAETGSQPGSLLQLQDAQGAGEALNLQLVHQTPVCTFRVKTAVVSETLALMKPLIFPLGDLFLTSDGYVHSDDLPIIEPAWQL